MTTFGRIVAITDPNPSDDVIEIAKEQLRRQANDSIRFFVNKNYELRDPETGEIAMVCQVGAKWAVDVAPVLAEIFQKCELCGSGSNLYKDGCLVCGPDPLPK